MTFVILNKNINQKDSIGLWAMSKCFVVRFKTLIKYNISECNFVEIHVDEDKCQLAIKFVNEESGWSTIKAKRCGSAVRISIGSILTYLKLHVEKKPCVELPYIFKDDMFIVDLSHLRKP